MIRTYDAKLRICEMELEGVSLQRPLPALRFAQMGLLPTQLQTVENVDLEVSG